MKKPLLKLLPRKRLKLNTAQRWTDAEDTVVRRLYRQQPASAIARQLERTRNGVIGRANRLGLCEPKAEVQP